MDRIGAGGTAIDPEVVRELLGRQRRRDPLAALTSREREVLALIARGLPNKLIARELGIAEKTVKTHVGHVLAKLGVTDRTQAALFAVREGLVGPGS